MNSPTLAGMLKSENCTQFSIDACKFLFSVIITGVMMTVVMVIDVMITGVVTTGVMITGGVIASVI